MEALFEKADFSTWERAEHFLYFRDRIKCRYTLNAEVDVTRLMEFRLDRGLKFFPLFLHVIMRAVNRSREFRMAYDSDGSPGWWSVVVPSYTIFHADDHTFSDIWSDYHENRMIFYDAVRADMETYREVKGALRTARRPPNFCSVSALPWLRFTSFSLDSWEESPLLFPLIRFGRYETRAGRTALPVAVCVHHAAADGWHTAKLFNDMQEEADGVDESPLTPDTAYSTAE